MSAAPSLTEAQVSPFSAKEFARGIMDNYLVDEGRMMSFPVDIVAIASLYNAEVFAAGLSREVAAISTKEEDGSSKILFSRRLKRDQRAYVVAKEFARIILSEEGKSFGHIQSSTTLSSFPSSPVDNWAYEFANEILMPAPVVRGLWAEGKSLKSVAKTFGVTQLVMEYRLAQLRLY